MRMMRWASPVAVSIALVCVLTAILWYTGRFGICPHDPVFLFLLPVTLVAFRYGTAAALLTILVSFACADFFLYQPLYTLNICSRAELGDLVFFSILALFSVKAASQLFRPSLGDGARADFGSVLYSSAIKRPHIPGSDR
jgi:K+-sensing histidine kinase KdpD